MRLALLAGGSPLRSVEGTVSRLAKGTYRVHVEGLRDSELALDVDGSFAAPLLQGEMLLVPKACDAKVRWNKRGTEQSITVIAERVS